MRTINALSILDQLDELRRKHHNDAAYGHTMRIACAVVASEAGYTDRNEWTEELKADAATAYAKDLNDPLCIF